MVDTAKMIDRRARRTILNSLIDAAGRKGFGAVALTDGDNKNFTYRELLRAAFALGGPLARMSAANERIGVLLPTGAGAVITLLALHTRGRVPAMLNFTSGSKNIIAACDAAEVNTIVTAHKFVEIGGLEKLIGELGEKKKICYLEDVKETLTWRDKARAIVGGFVPSVLSPKINPEQPGVILFTSGTEGAPKGVVLSHKNIVANTEQISAHVNLLPTDIFFNPLPTFHCYGLTAGTLWPLLSGYQTVLHPSPLQTKIIPKRIFETRSTVLFATDTFLSQYMRASADGGMSSLRFAVCGAERVRDETRHAAEKRFGFEVLEGYGVTEGSPVLAVNQPGDIRGGTVGRFLPALETRLEPVEGLEQGGRLHVRGPNIMMGYLRTDNPGKIVPLEDGWHDTGDIVAVDDDDYVVIKGRLKRFAKIGGEMVSLAVIENCASAVWPDNTHAAAILPDAKKGEQVVLVTDRQGAARAELLAWAQSHGVPEIAMPKKIVHVDAVPVLGTGKTDFQGVKVIAEQALASERHAKNAAANGNAETALKDAAE